MCKRMEEFLQNSEADFGVCGTWEAHKGKKHISLNGKAVGTVVRHAWKWSAYGKDTIPNGVREEAVDYAEDT